MENNRPVSITILSWILIGLSVLGFVTTFLLIMKVQDHSDYISAMGQSHMYYIGILTRFIGNVFLLLSGIFFLKGKNWMRIAFTIVIAFSFFGVIANLVQNPLYSRTIGIVTIIAILASDCESAIGISACYCYSPALFLLHHYLSES